jgi:hypothetical protein
MFEIWYLLVPGARYLRLVSPNIYLIFFSFLFLFLNYFSRNIDTTEPKSTERPGHAAKNDGKTATKRLDSIKIVEPERIFIRKDDFILDPQRSDH